MANPYLGVDVQLDADMSWTGTSTNCDVNIDSRGDLTLTDDIANVRQSLLFRLNTKFGDLWAHPDYGCGVWDLLSSPLSSTNLSIAVAAIKDCVNYDPRTTAINVSYAVDYVARFVSFAIVYNILDECSDSLALDINWEGAAQSV